MNKSGFVFLTLCFLITSCSPSTLAATLSPVDVPRISTQAISSQQSATSTPKALTAPISTATLNLETLAFELLKEVSPNGKWAVHIELSKPVSSGEFQESFYTRVTVISQDKQTVWTPIAEWRGYGLGFNRPIIFHWSQNGLYLYLADYAIPDGCPGFGYTSNLKRVDLRTGEADPIAPQLAGVISLSPDESTLVALTHNAITLYDLQTSQDQTISYRVEADFWISGNIVWSPDEREFLFAAMIDGCGPPEQGTTSIWHVNASKGEVITIASNDTRGLIIQEWARDNQVLLIDKNGKQWWLDVNSGDITDAP